MPRGSPEALHELRERPLFGILLRGALIEPVGLQFRTVRRHEPDAADFKTARRAVVRVHGHAGDRFECFRVMEAQTADLYTWLVALGRPGDDGTEYWEMIAPRSMTPAGLAARIETARRLARDPA